MTYVKEMDFLDYRLSTMNDTSISIITPALRDRRLITPSCHRGIYRNLYLFFAIRYKVIKHGIEATPHI